MAVLRSTEKSMDLHLPARNLHVIAWRGVFWTRPFCAAAALEKPTMAQFVLRVNGAPTHVEAPPEESLLSVLRYRLNLTGTKYGCGEGECGVCTVLLNGRAFRSCRVSVSAAANAEMTTIEGLERHGVLTPVQQAFMDEGAMQCGYCTSGMILEATALLDETPSPTEEQIMTRMNGNLCRCGTYPRIVSAVRRAAEGGRA